MVVEFARDVLKNEQVNSTEFDRATPHPVIDLMPDQQGITDMGGTMRLGLYPCHLVPGTIAAEAYREPVVQERHRHRFEFNNAYRQRFEENGMRFSGLSPDGRLVEIAETGRSSLHGWHPVPPRIPLPPQPPAPACSSVSCEAVCERAGRADAKERAKAHNLPEFSDYGEFCTSKIFTPQNRSIRIILTEIPTVILCN